MSLNAPVPILAASFSGNADKGVHALVKAQIRRSLCYVTPGDVSLPQPHFDSASIFRGETEGRRRTADMVWWCVSPPTH